MFSRRTAQLLLTILVIVPTAAAQDGHLWVGPNVNMVSGTTFPDGDPFLQRQNEPSIAVSTRDTMTLMGFANDYRAVDIPGLPEGKETGDSWLGVFKSFDAGLTWRSTLLPGYPQDVSPEGLASPIGQGPGHGAYDAGADPVVRAGTHGRFYLSGIVFDRGDVPRSAVFVSRYVDQNNRESGDPIEYIDTKIVKANPAGDPFIDKPWMAVDIPRGGTCGNVYLAWVEISGMPPNSRSDVMFTRSVDCGESWPETPIKLSADNTLNQGVTLAVSPTYGEVWVAWRQFETNPAVLSCAFGGGYWKNRPDEWPLEFIEMGGVTYSKAEALDILDSSRGGDATYILAKQLIPAKLNMAYSMAGGELLNLIVAADAWLDDNPLGSKPKREVKEEGIFIKDQLEAYNEGLLLADGCTTSILSPGTGNAIVAMQLSDAGVPLSPRTTVAPIHPLEQGTSPISFRTNAYPTITVGTSEYEVDRAYLAWTTRGEATPRSDLVEGDGRIVVSTSTNGSDWTTPKPIPVDQPEVPGHQLEPSITFAGGKVLLTYIDLRDDHSGIFERFIADWPSLENYRHTVDLRVASADPDPEPVFTDYSLTNSPNNDPVRPSDQVSRYVFIPYPADPEPPHFYDVALLQFQFNPPNLPIFVGGTRPFFGDYIDVAPSPPFVPDGYGGWRHNTLSGDSAVFHAAWTDNRDVEAPHDGNWANYVPPSGPFTNAGGQSLFDPGQTVPDCNAIPQGYGGQTRIRDQNTYTARISRGLFVASPGSSRPSDLMQRAFVVFVRNDTQEERTFRLSIEDDEDASFEQFSQLDQLEVQIPGFSSVSRTVFVESEIPFPSIQIAVNEVAGLGLSSTLLLNPDPTNPPPAEPGLDEGEVYNLAMMNPAMMNLAMMNPAMMNLAMMNLAMMNPAMMNLAMMNLAMMNPAMMNLAMMNLAMMNPAMMNPAMMNQAVYSLAMMNPAMMNPAMMNLAMMNPAMMNLAMMNETMTNASLTDLTWEVRHEGNAAAAYSVNMLMENAPEGFVYELSVYRLYTTPVADGCELIEEAQHQMLVHIIDPNLLSGDLLDPGNTDPGIGNATFWMEPGDQVYVTLRVVDPEADDEEFFDPTELTVATVAQGVNTEDAQAGSTQPPYSIPDISVPTPATMTAGRVQHTTTLLPDGKVLVTGGFNPLQAESSAEIYDPTTGLFTTTGSMTVPRTFHTATLLDNGKVLVVGMPLGGGPGPSAELYDPSEGTFSPTTGDLNVTRGGHRATKLADGRVLITGGAAAGPVFLNSAEIYDPSTDDFELLTDNMLQSRWEHTATLLTDGRVLIAGGQGSGANTAEVFDPTPDLCPPSFVPPCETFNPVTGAMSDTRRFHSATLLPDGKVLLAGGLPDGSWVANASADIYDPGTNSLSPTNGDLVGARGAHTATLLASGKVLIAGGITEVGGTIQFLSSVELYDWFTGTFAFQGDLTEARTEHAAVRLLDGDVLITGGTVPAAPITTGTDTFELYHPGLPSKMMLTESLGAARTYHTATLLPSGEVLVAGGAVRGADPWDGISIDSVERYDPATESFTPATSLPVGRMHHSATLLTDGRVLIAGGFEDLIGYTGAGILDTAVLYDPGTDSYSATGLMTIHRFDHEATLLFDGRVLLTGGRTVPNTPVSSAEIYDPGTNSFTAVPGGMSIDRFSHQATLLPDGRVLVTGGAPNAPGTHQTAEIWDPISGIFGTPIMMKEARQSHRATLMPNGKVLISGGFNENTPTHLDSMEIFDPADNSFTTTSATLSVARRSHTSTVLPDGRVLLTGGAILAPHPSAPRLHSVAEIYDPITDTLAVVDPLQVPRSGHTATRLQDCRVLFVGGWETYNGFSKLVPTATVEIYEPFYVEGFCSTGSMSTARWAHGATLLTNGEVLVAGGQQVNLPLPVILTTAELYDPVVGSFRPTGSLNQGRSHFAETRLADGKVLSVGGLFNGVPGVGEIYDPNAGVFTPTSGSSNAGYGATATLLPNGRVLVAGTGGTCSGSLASAELYDPVSTNFPATTGGLITRRAGHTATMLPDGRVLIAGGFACGLGLSSAEFYDPSTNTFSASGYTMSAPRYYHTATLLPSGKVLIAGGQDHFAVLSSAELYDPSTGAFTAVGGVMARPRYFHTSTLLPNGKVLVVGGRDFTSLWSSSEVYDPGTDSFSSPRDMATRRGSHRAVLLGNGKVLVVGGIDGVSEIAGAELYRSGPQ